MSYKQALDAGLLTSGNKYISFIDKGTIETLIPAVIQTTPMETFYIDIRSSDNVPIDCSLPAGTWQINAVVNLNPANLATTWAVAYLDVFNGETLLFRKNVVLGASYNGASLSIELSAESIVVVPNNNIITIALEYTGLTQSLNVEQAFINCNRIS
jgi:hypothetical protein